MKTKKTVTNYIILVIAVLVVLNILSDRFFVRLDLTKDKRYTLSHATKDILKNLDNPITVTAYFTEDLPPDYAKSRRDFKELLVEYANISKGKVLYEFINPNEEEDLERQAMQKGVQPVLVNIAEKDQMKQQKAYMGAVVQVDEESEVIPLIQPGISLEYDLSSAIKKVTVKDKPIIGFIQGNGESALNEFQEVGKELSILYQIEPVMLNDSIYNLNKYIALILSGTKDTISPIHLQQLDKYLSEGGNLFIGINRVQGDFNTITGTSVTTGLEEWLRNKGLMVENNFVIDWNSAAVTVNQQGFFQIQVKFPYLPIITNFADHNITKGLEAMVLQFASTMNYIGDTSVKFTPLAMTSEKSGTEMPPLTFNVNRQWTQNDFPLPKLTVAAALEGSFNGGSPSKMVVISNGNFAINGSGRNARNQQPDNINFMVNSIEWLSDKTGLAELRTKGITARQLDQMTDSKRVFLKYLNFLLPLILIIIYGVIRMQRKRNLRVKRMEEGYV
ncbi:GldG family protein [Bacteroidota bacterium]